MIATTSTQEEWFRNHVSATMSQLGVHETDADGDLPVHGVTSLGWVRVEPREPWAVRVFALAATGVPATAAVAKELNAAQVADRVMRVFRVPTGSVFVDHLLLADAVHADNLRWVIARALSLADDVGLMLATVHGGTTPISPTGSDSPAER